MAAMSWRAMKRLGNRLGDRDFLLGRLGLEERSPTSDFFTGLGLFSVGVLVGAGLGLLFAPRRGEEMRTLMGDAWRNRMQKGATGPDYQVMGAEAHAGGAH
jgi:hypothetical protein